MCFGAEPSFSTFRLGDWRRQERTKRLSSLLQLSLNKRAQIETWQFWLDDECVPPCDSVCACSVLMHY